MGSMPPEPRVVDYAEALERLQHVAERHRASLRELDRLIQRSSQSGRTITESSMNKHGGGDKTHYQRTATIKHNQLVQRPASFSIPSATKSHDHLSVPLRHAVGYRCAKTITALHSTPRHDSSAVHGFVLNSSLTKNASPSTPVLFRVAVRPQAATDTNTDLDSDSNSNSDLDSENEAESVDEEEEEAEKQLDSADSFPLCVAIMAGARIPVDEHPSMDAVIKFEDVGECSLSEKEYRGISHRVKIVKITEPVYLRQNRRLAGSDIQKGLMIVAKGEVIQTKHIMALASLRYAEIIVTGDSEAGPRTLEANLNTFGVAVVSAGSELIEIAGSASRVRTLGSTSDRDFSAISCTPNLGGPYLVSSMKAGRLDINITYKGIVSAERETLSGRLREMVDSNRHDVIVVTGSALEDRLNSLRHIVENNLHGEVVFHDLAISPGQTVLMAVVSTTQHSEKNGSVNHGSRHTVIFGLPGDPVATAATFHFVVSPYLNWLISDNYSALKDEWIGGEGAQISMYKQYSERQQLYRQCVADFPYKKAVKTKPNDATIFWLGHRMNVDDDDDDESSMGRSTVQILEDQATYRVGTLLQANCWVIAPPGVFEVVKGDEVTTLDFGA